MPKVSKPPKHVKGITHRPGAERPYQAAINLLMPNGTRLRLKQSFATLPEAEAWRAAMRADRLRQQRGLPTPETTSEYMARWLAGYRVRTDLKARTRQDAANILRIAKLVDADGEPCDGSPLGRIKLAELQPKTVRDHLQRVVSERGRRRPLARRRGGDE